MVKLLFLGKMQLKQIAKVGYVLPSEENKETEKALRRIATKGGWDGK